MSTWSSGPNPRAKRRRETPPSIKRKAPQREGLRSEEPMRGAQALFPIFRCDLQPKVPLVALDGPPPLSGGRGCVPSGGDLARLPHPDDCTGRHNGNDRDDDRPNHVFNHACPLKRSRRRRCNTLGRSLGSSADRCAISVARSRAALTAAMPRASRPSARLTSLGAAKSCSLVNNFMIRPPTANSNDSNEARSRPSHGHVVYSNVNGLLE
jgi:hypothetical protein